MTEDKRTREEILQEILAYVASTEDHYCPKGLNHIEGECIKCLVEKALEADPMVYIFLSGGLVSEVYNAPTYTVIDMDGFSESGDYCPLCGGELEFQYVNALSRTRDILLHLRAKLKKQKTVLIKSELQHVVCSSCGFDWDSNYTDEDIMAHARKIMEETE